MRVGARMSPKQRLAVRQIDWAPLLSDLRSWFETARLPGRNPTAEAISHALNRRNLAVGTGISEGSQTTRKLSCPPPARSRGRFAVRNNRDSPRKPPPRLCPRPHLRADPCPRPPRLTSPWRCSAARGALHDAAALQLPATPRTPKTISAKSEVVSRYGSASDRIPPPARCTSRAITRRSVVSRDSRSRAGSSPRHWEQAVSSACQLAAGRPWCR